MSSAYSSCIKASLLPTSSSTAPWTFCTRAISNVAGSKPNFGENCPLSVPRTKLPSKTLQVKIIARCCMQ